MNDGTNGRGDLLDSNSNRWTDCGAVGRKLRLKCERGLACLSDRPIAACGRRLVDRALLPPRA